MSDLIKVVFQHNTSRKQDLNILFEKYLYQRIKYVWLDPFDKPVAVALLEKPVDASLLEKQKPIMDNHNVNLSVCKPTWSVIVRLYKEYSQKDFSKHILCKIKIKGNLIEKVSPTCFEIAFLNGWGDVQAVCQHKGSSNREIKSIDPYFECFKVAHRTVAEPNAFYTSASSNGALPKHPQPLLVYPASNQHDITKVSVSTHPLISVLLDALKFPENRTLQQQGIKAQVDLYQFTITLEGSICSVLKIKHMLEQESNKVNYTELMIKFLEEKTIQQQIKHIITEHHFCLILDLDTSEVYIKDSQDNKILLRDVQSQFLIEIHCASLPRDYNRNMFDMFKKDFEANNKYFKVLLDYKRTVVLLGVTENNKDDTHVAIVNEFISTNFKFGVGSSNGHDLQKTYEHTASLTSECECSSGKFKAVINYPGLIPFLNSEEGNAILKKLLSKHNIPLDTGTHVQTLDKVPDYRALFICKVRIGSYQLHLVHGETQDANISKKIIFTPVQEGFECEVKDNGLATEVLITLPPYRALSEQDFREDLNRLRKSFYKAVDYIFEIIKDSSLKDVAFSTSAIHGTEFPFPLDVISKCILEATQKDTELPYGLCNIYIFESQASSVFEAFQYYLKRSGVYIEGPDVETWCRISFRGSHQYSPVKAKVEVRSNNPIKKRSVLYCYPVDPSLSASSSPVMNELMCFKSKLIKSIIHFKQTNEIGLLVGHCCKVKCFINKAPAVLFSMPPWGPECHKAIQDSFKACLTEAMKYNTIHIVPPGICTYPKKYLAQTICKVLHQLLLERSNLKDKHVVLVVDNAEYRKAFQIELPKYFTSAAKKGSSWVNIHNFQTTDESNDAITVEGPSQKIVKSFEADLRDQLNHIMKKNCFERFLNSNLTTQFKAMFSGAQNLNVQLDIQEFYGEKKEYPRAGNSSPTHATDQSLQTSLLTGSKLQIKALKSQWIEDFNVFLAEIASNIPILYDHLYDFHGTGSDDDMYD
ncbi:uncharacterized protein LOC106053092 [Biomphalaria glabrata]|uniref:Uncharacterized protein LOC106053092 n=1 Tax=Biomphalaria glabrata TaxID=6526 RepID=A0A9W2YMJ1_BIOGL|nr:uncharacterized protein LOC106053092 [Biomphalaria glabrata]XP_055863892.1 uncharacterized protein LOC106053092 [Biomphalaria glabrata]XP_055863901.1 uncharacterized protein LOC106053092 [Biomphalaria glabrata]XP_055863912.1 uncharacterized protein LOC106053092 [Biomphalaria glabrata]XP_055863922.1 uncharacterized protein LOC106053092 [Biomphalaria glabrata]XP_055863929.1 uncharacterized protein LOC106053092 [Biomphalaria glabrata]